MYDYRVKKYIGAYAASLNGVDAIVLQGASANAEETRKGILKDMDYLGVKLDEGKIKDYMAGNRLSQQTIPQ